MSCNASGFSSKFVLVLSLSLSLSLIGLEVVVATGAQEPGATRRESLVRTQVVISDRGGVSLHQVSDGVSLLQVSREIPAGLTNSDATDRALRLLNIAYGGHVNDPWYASIDISIDHEKAKDEVAHAKGGDAVAAVYGELLPVGVIAMLNHVNATPGQKYYDLGSGFGKTAGLAYLLGLDATGVELATGRWEKACEALTSLKKAEEDEEEDTEKVERKVGLKFVKASFTGVDFSDADIVFTDSVEFNAELLENLAKGARKLKPGALVVSFQGLPNAPGAPPGFEHVKDFVAKTSWSEETSWTLQRVISQPSMLEKGVAENSEANDNTCSL